MTNLGVLNLPGAPVQFLSAEDGFDRMMTMMAGFKDGYLLLDEVGVFLPSRLWSRMPLDLSIKWAQLRKDGVQLRWTCPRPGNAVKDLREITFETHWCASMKRFGLMTQAHYEGVAVGDKKAFRSRTWQRFRPRLAGELYDTFGKVSGPAFGSGQNRGAGRVAAPGAEDGRAR